MTKKELIKELLLDIAKLSNKATNKNEAIAMGEKTYLAVDYASIYGGYRLIQIGIDNGGHYGVFGGNGCEPRLNYSTFIVKLKGLLEGLRYHSEKE